MNLHPIHIFLEISKQQVGQGIRLGASPGLAPYSTAGFALPYKDERSPFRPQRSEVSFGEVEWLQVGELAYFWVGGSTTTFGPTILLGI